jgi:hypothetical protein
MRRIVFAVLVLASVAAIYRLQRAKAESPLNLDPVIYFIGDRV